MATLGRKRDDAQYSKLTAMTQPEATPTKRIGSEAPIGAATAGPAAGKSAAEFTQTTKGSPGSVFKRQLGGADISGITRLAEQPLLREFGEEAGRLAREGIQYKQQVGERLSKEPQYKEVTSDVIGGIAGGGSEFEKAQQILGREKIEMPTFTTAPVKEFTPMQALRGGTVESLIRKEAQGPYTTGMAGLDALLFAKKGGAGELAQRGLGLRTAAQTAADLLQGKTSGAIPGAIKGQLESLGLTDAGDLTAEARKKAEELVTSQKEQLQKGIRGDITAREEFFTKKPATGMSELQKAQSKLESESARKLIEGQRKAAEKIAQERQQLGQSAIGEAFFRLYPQYKGQFLADLIPYQNQEIMQAIQADPEYKRQQQFLNEQILSKLPVSSASQYVSQGSIPTLGLRNVMTPEQATQYNRLQELIGGTPIQQQTITAPEAQFDQARLDAYIRDLIAKSDYMKQPPKVSQPLGPSSYAPNIQIF